MATSNKKAGAVAVEKTAAAEEKSATVTEIVMDAKKPRAKRVSKNDTQSPGDRNILLQIVGDYHSAKKREWLRTQFVAWWANLVGEIETVQAQLTEETGELYGSFDREERWNLDEALQTCWDALSGTLRKPQCVPAFLKAEPVHFPKFGSTEGTK